MTEIQKTCVQCKLFFLTSQQDLRKTSDLTVEDTGMHHTRMVCNFVTGLQEALQQDQVQTETPTVVQAPVDHVANAVQNIQKQLATQLHQMQAMMTAM